MLEVELAVTVVEQIAQDGYNKTRGGSFHIELLQTNEPIPCRLHTTLHQRCAKGYFFSLLCILLDPSSRRSCSEFVCGRGRVNEEGQEKEKEGNSYQLPNAAPSM